MKKNTNNIFLFHSVFVTIGLISAIIFCYYHFSQGGCGFVRFYIQFFGIIVLGIWLFGTIVGLSLVIYGKRIARILTVFGSVIIVVVNIGMLVTALVTTHHIREADYSLKSTDLLLELASQENDREALWELGERRAVPAVPLLCEILKDTTNNINSRLNAAKALGQICSALDTTNENRKSAVNSLISALHDQEKYVRQLAAEALGIIGDTQAVNPLLNLLQNDQEDEYVIEEIVIALCIIGDKRAIQPIQELVKREEEKNRATSYRIRKALEKLESQE